MSICKCDFPDRAFIEIGDWKKCDLTDNRNTSFMIFQCNKCNGITGFPPDNLKLALEEGTEKTKRILKTIIE